MAFEVNLKKLLANSADEESILLLHNQLYASAAHKTAFDSACRAIKFDNSSVDSSFITKLIQNISPEYACSLRTAASYIFMRVANVAKFTLDADSSTKLNRVLSQEADESVQCNVIRAMSNLAQVPQNATSSAVSVPRILQIVGETRDVTLLVNCFRSIRYLCQGHNIRLLQKHDVLLSKICDILQDLSAEQKHAFTDEADFDERDAAGRENDAAPLKNGEEDTVAPEQRETRLRHAMSALAFVTRPRAQLIVASSPYIQHLERAVPLVCELTHHENTDTQTVAVAILLNLAECPAARPSLETSGAIQALIDYVAPIGLSSSSFVSGNSASKSQLDSARALFILCADGSSRSKIRRLGALRLLLQVLRAEPYKPVWMRGTEAILMFKYDLHALKELLSIGLMEVLLDKLNALLELVHRQMMEQVNAEKRTPSSLVTDVQTKKKHEDAQRQDEVAKRRLSVSNSGSGRPLKAVPAPVEVAVNVEFNLASLEDDAGSATPPPTQPLKRRRLTAVATLPCLPTTATRSSTTSPSMSPSSSSYNAASSDNSPLGGHSSRSSTPMQSPSYLRAMSPPSKSFDVCGNLIRSLDRLTSAASPPYNSPPYRSSSVWRSKTSGGSNKRLLHEPDPAEAAEIMPTAVSREATLCINIVKFSYHLSHSDEFAAHVCIEKFFSTSARILLLFTSASMQTTPATEIARQLVSTVSRSLQLCVRSRSCFESIVKAKCASWVDAFGKSKLSPEDAKYGNELSQGAADRISQFRLELLGELVNVAQTDYGFGTVSHMLQPSNREHIRRVVSLCVPHVYRRSNLLKRLLLYDGAFRCLMALVFESDLFTGDYASKHSGHSSVTGIKNVDDADGLPRHVPDDADDECQTPSNEEDAAAHSRRCDADRPNSALFSSISGDADVVDANAMRALRGLQVIMQYVNDHNSQRARQQQQVVGVQASPQKRSFVNTSLTAATCCVYETFTENKPALPMPDKDDIITLAINNVSVNGGLPVPVLRCPARRSALMRISSYFEARLADYWDAKQENEIAVDVIGLEDVDFESDVMSIPKSPKHRESDYKNDGVLHTFESISLSGDSAQQLRAYRNRKRDEQTLLAFVHALHGCSPTSCRLMASLWETNTSQFILKFLLVADQFLCESLFSMCLDWLQVNCLSEDSVADVYSLAQNRLTNVKGLADTCIRFVLGEVADVEQVLLIFCDFVQCSSVEILRSHVEKLFQHCLKTL